MSSIIWKISIFLLITNSYYNNALEFEGDKCVLENSEEDGLCKPIGECDYARNLLQIRKYPQICGFQGDVPLVCCPLSAPSPLTTSSLRSGENSIQKCNSYYPKRLYHQFIFAGTKALSKEFPHMAIVGFGVETDIEWLCGGSLISEQFILTAAHCIFSQSSGAAKWVRLGDLDIRNTTDDAKPQNFNIIETFRYPEFHVPSHYNDIALLKLDRFATFDEYVRPGCLQVENKFPENSIFSATGWGKVEFVGETSDQLLKVDLNLIKQEECAKSYKDISQRKLPNGINEELQICAGRADGGDTCPGDSGGPLQYKSFTNGNPHYYIIGVTSFGKACGIEDSVGVYTRVSHYVSWIEDIVWA